jgi:uncharacterized protein Yka (UPF0111/DUF47 family)
MGILGFSLIPRELKFFDLFDEAAATLTRASGKFVSLLSVYDRLPERCKELKEEETRMDDIVGGIIKALDQTFITPFDREDIHTLATSLDDIMDNLEETAHRFDVFRIDRPTEVAVKLGRIILDCCTHLEQAIRECRNLRKSEEIHNHLRAIGRLENEADKLYRDSDSALFAHGAADILMLIKLRELYSWLEETVDACKDASQVISEIVVKGS